MRDEFQVNVPEFTIVPFDDVVRIVSGRVTLNQKRLRQVHEEIVAQQWQKVSFRTSAIDEDGAHASFAGQYDSFVDIDYSEATLKKYILACYKSTTSQAVRRYAALHGRAVQPGGSVVIQKMFYGKTSGVIFSEDGKGNMQVAYSRSWRNSVVDNDSAEELLVAKNDLHTAKVPSYIQQLVVITSRLEREMSRPVDIEWSYDGRSLAFLQIRPLTTLSLDYQLAWDSTNISENYPGVTLPLTYSFIRSVYATVYPDFLKRIGISKKKLDAHRAMFAHMLGYFEGRVFYRISSWYQLVDVIPGSKNRSYFEAMLNPVKKQAAQTQHQRTDIRSVIALLRFLCVLAASQRLSKRFERQFAVRFEVLQRAVPDGVNAEVVFRNIQQTKRTLLELWSIPVLNDVRVMIFHGILKKRLLKRYSHETYLNFLQGLTDRASIKPLRELGALGEELREHTGDVKDAAAIAHIRGCEACQILIRNYTQTYNARTPDELKLESVRLGDSIEAIAPLALHSSRTTYDVSRVERSAQKTVIRHNWVTLILAHHTRRAIDWRERFRFNRAQAFRLASDAYLVVGTRFCEENIINNARDIYYLTEQEIDEIINGHAWNYDVAKLVANRKRDQKRYEKSALSLRVTGSGLIATTHLSNDLKKTGSVLAGMGVSKGVISGEVIMVKSFDPTLNVSGKILVVTHIDPGWTLLFTQAAGVITERGNALSHVAIVARELNIPAIVAVPEATTRYQSGDFVTIDGTTGEIILGTHKRNRS